MRGSNKTKQAVSITLHDMNYAVKDIAQMLGVHRTTVYRYSKQPLSADLHHFATEIREMYLVKQKLLLAKCLEQIGNIIPKQSDLKSLLLATQVLTANIEKTEETLIRRPLVDPDLEYLIDEESAEYEPVDSTNTTS